MEESANVDAVLANVRAAERAARAADVAEEPEKEEAAAEEEEWVALPENAEDPAPVLVDAEDANFI